MDESRPTDAPFVRRHGRAIVALWVLLWALVPAVLVWATKPYLRGPTISFDGRSHAELEAELNNRYAVEYLILGALFGLAGGAVALRLTRAWQVLALAAAVGVALGAAFYLHNRPPYTGWGEMVRTAVIDGILFGGLFGLVLAAVHRRAGRCP